MKVGIVGLPNVGKSTLFNVLTKAGAASENYPFCTIEPNVGVVSVPDLRLEQLTALVKPQNSIATSMNFVDIAGLVAGASKGEGLGNQFLANIREATAIAHVVRCYEDDNIVHVAGKVDPVADCQTIETELILADIATVERALEKNTRLAKTGQKEAKLLVAAFEELHSHLESAKMLRLVELSESAQAEANNLRLLTIKPMLYIANVADDSNEQDQHLQALQAYVAPQPATQLVTVCASIESELIELSGEELAEFLTDLGMAEPGLNRVIRAGYDLLGLGTFFTAGEKEVRAWTFKQGFNAAQAAGVIHSDFEKHFIRAEIVSFADYIQHGGETGAKQAGLWRLEGKDYIVQDGDVIYFRTSA